MDNRKCPNFWFCRGHPSKICQKSAFLALKLKHAQYHKIHLRVKFEPRSR